MKGDSCAFQTIGVNDHNDFYCLKTNEVINSDVRLYSRFKFGDVEAIEYLSSNLANFFIGQLYVENELRSIFEKSKLNGEYIYVQSPGIRNVASASYYLMTSVAKKVNVWLACNKLPTMIQKPVVRLASGIANYAELSEENRKKRIKTTVSLLPLSDYSSHPINVIFIDDVEITGCTRERARKESLRGGALSFNSLFIYSLDPNLAKLDASLESSMNQYEVKGELDETICEIVSHRDYQPVQRMLRLLLHPRNRVTWREFSKTKIPDTSLLRIYVSALSNDYHLITQSGEEEGLYAPSLAILGEVLEGKGLICSSSVYS